MTPETVYIPADDSRLAYQRHRTIATTARKSLLDRYPAQHKERNWRGTEFTAHVAYWSSVTREDREWTKRLSSWIKTGKDLTLIPGGYWDDDRARKKSPVKIFSLAETVWWCSANGFMPPAFPFRMAA
jgi:hypothetical protein